MIAQAEFKEFEPGLKFGWAHLKIFNLSRRLIETGFGDLRRGGNSLNSDIVLKKLTGGFILRRERNIFFGFNTLPNNLTNCLSEKGLKGTVQNWTCYSIKRVT